MSHEDNNCKFRKIKCKHSEDGCDFTGKVDILRGHEDSCKFRKIECKNSDNGCTFMGKKDTMRRHQIVCRHREIECKYSGDGCHFTAKIDILMPHQDGCKFRKIKCRYSNDGCDFLGKKDILAEHEKSCSHRKIECKYSEDGCKFTGKTSRMSKHEGNCNFRKIKCPEWMCTERIPFQGICDHLKAKHTVVNVELCDGKGTMFWDKEDSSPGSMATQFGICTFEGYTFLLMCIVEWRIWRSRVMIVGDKEDAHKFEIGIYIGSKDASRPTDFNMELQLKGKTKIHSVLEDKQQVKCDDEGVLEFTNSMVKNMLEMDGDGKSGIRAQYLFTKKRGISIIRYFLSWVKSKKPLPTKKPIKAAPLPSSRFARQEERTSPASYQASAASTATRQTRFNWECKECTYQNTARLFQCEMCGNERDDACKQQ